MMSDSHRNISPPERCPICGGASFQKKYLVNFYGIYQCAKCKSGFTHPRPETQEVPGIYGDDYWQHYQGTLSHGETYVDWRYKKLTRLLDSAPFDNTYLRLSVIDIGCGTGFFLSRFKSEGWETTGIDVSQQLAEYAINHFGIEVLIGDFLGMDLPSHTFDLVTMIHVIEHFNDPNIAMMKARSLLKQNGKLFIETPNWDGLGSILGKYKWHALIPPEHLSFFGPSSMRHLAEINGFQVNALQTVVPPFLKVSNNFPKIFERLTRFLYFLSSVIDRGPTLQVLLSKNS